MKYDQTDIPCIPTSSSGHPVRFAWPVVFLLFLSSPVLPATVSISQVADGAFSTVSNTPSGMEASSGVVHRSVPGVAALEGSEFEPGRATRVVGKAPALPADGPVPHSSLFFLLGIAAIIGLVTEITSTKRY